MVLRARLTTPRVRLTSAGPSGARTQGGGNSSAIAPTEDDGPRRSVAARRARGVLRPALRLALAGCLGLATALLMSCGSGGGTANLIPVGNAGPLKSDFDAVAAAVAAGNCPMASAEVSKAQADLAALPQSVDQLGTLVATSREEPSQNSWPRVFSCQAMPCRSTSAMKSAGW